jgi:hypothetical protein
MVVFLTEVAQPHVLQLLAHVLGNGCCAVVVAEVSSAAFDARLKVVRVWSV